MKRGAVWREQMKRARIITPAQMQLAQMFPEVGLIITGSKLHIYEKDGREPVYTFVRTTEGAWEGSGRLFGKPSLAARWAVAMMQKARFSVAGV